MVEHNRKLDVLHVCTTSVNCTELVLAAVHSRITTVIVEKPFTGFCGDGSNPFTAIVFRGRRVGNMP
jgi:hypothetical protein